MTLGQALALVQPEADASQRRKIFLACGFQPLHLATFLKAHLAQRFPDQAAEIETGTYGDLEGTLAAAAGSQAEAAAVVIEWSDLDPRLGLRSAGGWHLSVQADILKNCRDRFARLAGGLKAVAVKMPVALAAATLPMPLLGHTAGWQSSLSELELQKQMAAFVAESALISGVSVIHSSSLARLSPEASRLDALMELAAGFPYTIAHASAVASQAVKLLYPPSPMKGLITDLDETLWSGIVGEVGSRGVSWSLAEHTQIHGLYQQMLRHLSEMGVLLAIASKNEPAVVEEALRRDDLYIPRDAFFPVCTDWQPKSNSAATILGAWNIGAESVVFVDDSPMELEEVRSAFPSMTCLQFPTAQPAQTLHLLEKLRDLFGKPAVQREDALRQFSIRTGALVREAARQTSSREFLKELRGKVTFDTRKDSSNQRFLELINKTNQFNLNGVRISEGEWMRHLADPAGFVLGVSYEDKFGPLGVIGVVAGKRTGRRLEVSTWVMSCRAFSRRIEYHTLQHLFESGAVETISFGFKSTERNAPLRQFFSSIGAPAEGIEKWVLSRAEFLRGEHELPHSATVVEEPPGTDMAGSNSVAQGKGPL